MPSTYTVTTVLWMLITAIPAYFCGCFNGAVIVSKYILKDDVRNHGSGNAGLTNFHRTFGGKLTAVVLLLDVVKMVVAVFVGVLAAARLGTPGAELGILAKYWAGVWCLLGHMFPCTFGFKGGKGILSGVTLLFCVDWRVGAIALGLFIVVVALTRYISLGSILATASSPVSLYFLLDPNFVDLSLAVAVALLVIFMHRGNIVRLLKGTENKFSFHRKEQ